MRAGGAANLWAFGGSRDARILRQLRAICESPGLTGSLAFTGGGVSYLHPITNAVITGRCEINLQLAGFGNIKLLYGGPARENLFLNSQAPATQDVTVATGTVTVMAIGTGYTLTTAAKTATGSGFGAVTPGTPQVLTITGAGTITLTVTGTPANACVQVEQGAISTPMIVTAGAPVTRPRDVHAHTLAAASNGTEFELWGLEVPINWSVAANTAHPSGLASRLCQGTNGTSHVLNRSGAQDNFSVIDAGGPQAASISTLGDTHRTLRILSGVYESGAARLYRGETLAVSDTTGVTAPANAQTAIHVANQPNGSTPWFGFCGYLLFPRKLLAAERGALFRAAANGRTI
jgi:hypothetical protein